MEIYENSQEDIYLMGIDVTYANKNVVDNNGKYFLILGKRCLKPIVKIYAINQQGNSFLVNVR